MGLIEGELTLVSVPAQEQEKAQANPFVIKVGEVHSEEKTLLKQSERSLKLVDQRLLSQLESTVKSEYIQNLETFKHRGFIANEGWAETINFQGQIDKVEGDLVSCSCLIDKDTLYFESRYFPKFLFGHLKDLAKRPFVFITIQSKHGSSRIDIVNGEALVNKKYFETKEKLDRLRDMDDFNNEISGPIKA